MRRSATVHASTSLARECDKRDCSTVAVRLFWRVVNPLMRVFAGLAPWWVLVETTGRRTGKPRRTPLAAGPRDEAGMLVIAVHGRHSAWVLNAEANPSVRVRYCGRWRSARAELLPWDEDRVRTFNLYARSGPKVTARDPQFVRLTYATTR
jgi:deazaflavin-dependent oxidoreductase (nitroreductase family)